MQGYPIAGVVKLFWEIVQNYSGNKMRDFATFHDLRVTSTFPRRSMHISIDDLPGTVNH